MVNYSNSIKFSKAPCFICKCKVDNDAVGGSLNLRISFKSTNNFIEIMLTCKFLHSECEYQIILQSFYKQNLHCILNRFIYKISHATIIKCKQ